MTPPFVPVGFDYAQTILELRSRISYERIAEYCGYENKGSIAAVVEGAIPLHPAGEALYALYLEIFGRKPPMRTNQAIGSHVPLPAVFLKRNGKSIASR